MDKMNAFIAQDKRDRPVRLVFFLCAMSALFCFFQVEEYFAALIALCSESVGKRGRCLAPEEGGEVCFHQFLFSFFFEDIFPLCRQKGKN